MFLPKSDASDISLPRSFEISSIAPVYKHVILRDWLRALIHKSINTKAISPQGCSFRVLLERATGRIVVV